MPKKANKELTPRQRETLEWIKNFIREHGMPPTVREIGRAFGIKSSSVFDLLKALERKSELLRGEAQQIELEMRHLSKPNSIKKGLMQDRLTSRVRVSTKKKTREE